MEQKPPTDGISPVAVVRPDAEAGAHLPHLDRLVSAAAHLVRSFGILVHSI